VDVDLTGRFASVERHGNRSALKKADHSIFHRPYLEALVGFALERFHPRGGCVRHLLTNLRGGNGEHN
jgi:hypothetical protein